jgi:hypothetical protein
MGKKFNFHPFLTLFCSFYLFRHAIFYGRNVGIVAFYGR